ncbi:MAG: HEAT repeat domain-containing protein [Acidobacteria bacterium]|nr:HEAT repeat domain-containing protein [Acidobacteriota bacterium]
MLWQNRKWPELAVDLSSDRAIVSNVKPRGLVILTGFLLCSAALLLSFAGTADPVYNGKRLSIWLRTFNNPQPGNPEYTKAVAAVRAADTKCLPLLLKTLRAKDSAVWTKLVNLARKQHFIKINYDNANTRRDRAIHAFGILGSRADPAIPVLLEMIQQPLDDSAQFPHWYDPQYWAGYALAQIGRTAARPLAELLPKPDYILRHRVLNLLNFRFRPEDAQPAIPGLMRCLVESKETEFRNRAAHCIQLIARTDCDALVQMNIARLRDPNRFARRDAAYQLGQLGQAATNAIPALMEALADTDIRVRAEAGFILSSIGPNDECDFLSAWLSIQHKLQ